MLSLSYLPRPPVCPSLTKKEPVGANSPYQRLVPFLLSSQESGSSNGHLFCFIMLFIHYRIISHQHYKNVIFSISTKPQGPKSPFILVENLSVYRPLLSVLCPVGTALIKVTDDSCVVKDTAQVLAPISLGLTIVAFHKGSHSPFHDIFPWLQRCHNHLSFFPSYFRGCSFLVLADSRPHSSNIPTQPQDCHLNPDNQFLSVAQILPLNSKCLNSTYLLHSVSKSFTNMSPNS